MKKKKTVSCQKCGKALIPINNAKCSHCGNEVFSLCDGCEKITAENEAYCQACNIRTSFSLLAGTNLIR